MHSTVLLSITVVDDKQLAATGTYPGGHDDDLLFLQHLLKYLHQINSVQLLSLFTTAKCHFLGLPVNVIHMYSFLKLRIEL